MKFKRTGIVKVVMVGELCSGEVFRVHEPPEIKMVIQPSSEVASILRSSTHKMVGVLVADQEVGTLSLLPPQTKGIPITIPEVSFEDDRVECQSGTTESDVKLAKTGDVKVVKVADLCCGEMFRMNEPPEFKMVVRPSEEPVSALGSLSDRTIGVLVVGMYDGELSLLPPHTSVISITFSEMTYRDEELE